jgi:anaerobic dimethyl sulfoxide reductase subunit B (iron-sulfur subunit)
MHCTDPECVAACPENALTQNTNDGIVLVDESLCTACETCRQACPFDAPQFGKKEKMQKCDLCNGRIDYQKEKPPCVATCPTKALVFRKVSIQEKRVQDNAIKKLLQKVT